MKKFSQVVIDLSNVKNEKELHLLFKEKLGFPDSYQMSFNAMWKILSGQEIGPYRVKICNIEKMPIENAKKTLRQIAEKLWKVPDYNISFDIVEEVEIDLSNIKTYFELHSLFKEKLNFPEWYGMNFAALWDLLTGYIGPSLIKIYGLNKLPMKQAKEILRDIAKDLKNETGFQLVLIDIIN